MAIDKAIEYVEQDGVNNYVKNSESVTVPKRFKARKNAPATKLAYITDSEAKMLKKMKKGTPHKGPKGIPSYDSFDAEGNFTSGAAMSAAETGGRSDRDRRDTAAGGLSPQDVQDLRSSAIAAGAGQRVNPGFFDSKNVVSPAELRAAKQFAPKAFRKTRGGGLLGLLTGGGIIGNLIRGIGQSFGLGKKFNQPTYDMSRLSGLPLGGSAAFQNLDIRDKFNRLGDDEETSGIISAILSDPTNLLPQISAAPKTPLSIFDNSIAPMGVRPNKGVIQALASATVPEIMTDYVNQLERGEPITEDEQMFIDNEIAALRGYR